MKKFLDYITKDQKGQRIWAILFGSVGTMIAFAMAILFWDSSRELYKNIGPSLSVPIGFLCVYYLGIQKNRGNILGMVANVNELIVNILFGNFGFVAGAVYNGISHVVGFLEWNTNSNESGVTQVRDIKERKGIVTLIFFLVLGTVFVFANWHFNWIGNNDLSSPIFWGNIVILYLGIVAQGAMVLRYRYSWWLWFAVNIIAIPIQFVTGNYVFGVMFIFYELNCVLSLYAQYTSENVEA
ncbi:MAG: nicotinamide riboside transporter PnuC [Culicoidibacterales bacterium]